MRRFEKKQNIAKANLLVEQRYLESKGIIMEVVSDMEVSNAEHQNNKALEKHIISKLNDELDRYPIMSKYSLRDEETKILVKNIRLITKGYDPKTSGPYIEFDNNMGWFTIEPKGVTWRLSSSVKVSEDNWKTFMGLGYRVIDESSGLNDAEKNLLKDRLRDFIDNTLRNEVKRNN